MLVSRLTLSSDVWMHLTVQQEPELIVSGTGEGSSWQDSSMCPDTPLLDEQCSIFGLHECEGDSGDERRMKEAGRESLMSRITGLLEREGIEFLRLCITRSKVSE